MLAIKAEHVCEMGYLPTCRETCKTFDQSPEGHQEASAALSSVPPSRWATPAHGAGTSLQVQPCPRPCRATAQAGCAQPCPWQPPLLGRGSGASRSQSCPPFRLAPSPAGTSHPCCNAVSAAANWTLELTCYPVSSGTVGGPCQSPPRP